MLFSLFSRRRTRHIKGREELLNDTLIRPVIIAVRNENPSPTPRPVFSSCSNAACISYRASVRLAHSPPSIPMPFRRPTSPLSLEVCLPPKDDDIDLDVILGSDDELDEDARAAQRQRIEKLGEAYLQGTPLFILSASLKGPFDEGWVNPWRKGRKPERSHNVVEESDGPVVRETDPRPRGQFYESQEQSQRATSSIAPSDAPSEDHHRTSSKQKHSHRPSRDKLSRQGTPKRAVPRTNDIQLNLELHDSSIARPKDDNWLKRDRRRIGFRDFDPPTSPTTTVSTRYSDTRNRGIKAVRHESPLKRWSPARAEERQPVSSPAVRSQVLRHSDPINNHPPQSTKPTPSRQQAVPHPNAQDFPPSEGDTSFCVVSSSSQLPKFKYRRRKKRRLNEKERSESSSIRQAGIERPMTSDINQDNRGFHQHEPSQQEPHQQEPMSSKESRKQSTEPDELQSDQQSRHAFPSTTSHANGAHFNSRLNQGHSNSRATHGDTTDEFPSAQPVPPNPAMVDYAPSLHTAAFPTGTESNDDSGPDSHLSTQAALLHAQKSFQDGLEIQSQDPPPTTSAKKRRPSQPSPLSSINSHNITPFHRINTKSNDNNLSGAAAGAAMPSTQYMMDAVTPFTFSTEKKKRHVHIGSSSGVKSSNKKQKITSSVNLSPQSCYPWSLSPEGQHPFEDRNHQSAKKSSPIFSQRSGSPNAQDHSQEEGSQTPALPLTLTGSTPPTGPDGQLGAEKFNLSQAIADAGSWLQDSFDINRDLRQFDVKPGASSAGTRKSAVNLDTH